MLDILIRNWNPKIGDPTLMGWVTVAAYFGAAVLLCLQWRKIPSLHSENLRLHRGLILLFVITMFGLGVNKQLDLQTWVTNVGRDISKAQGWWENRRIAQVIVLAVIVLFGMGLLAVIVRAGGVLKAHRLALFGYLVLLGFVVMRATSFFQMDRLINERIMGIRMNWVFELSGIAIIATSAIRALLKRPESD